MDGQEKPKIARRDLLRVFAAGAGAATIAPLSGAAFAAESPAEEKKSRYRETEHVKTFYRVNQYPPNQKK